MLNGNKYDFEFIVKKYGTDDIEALEFLTKNTNDEIIRTMYESADILNEELDKSHNLARAVGGVPLDTDLLEYVGK